MKSIIVKSTTWHVSYNILCGIAMKYVDSKEQSIMKCDNSKYANLAWYKVCLGIV